MFLFFLCSVQRSMVGLSVEMGRGGSGCETVQVVCMDDGGKRWVKTNEGG